MLSFGRRKLRFVFVEAGIVPNPECLNVVDVRLLVQACSRSVP